MTHQDAIELATQRPGEMHDITDAVRRIVGESGIRAGLCHIFNIGSTASVGTIEYEPGLEADLPQLLERIAPPSTDYGHEQTWHDGNGHSHLQATLMGPGLTIPVRGGRPALGTWQQVFHLECDIKPRSRTIIVTVQGD